MGIGDWFGFGRKEEPKPIIDVPAPPTSESLLQALDNVERLAADGVVPPMVMARLKRVTKTVRQTIPRLDSLGGRSSASGYNVVATATDYLPGAINGYLRLPRDWADSRPVDRGKTSLLILIDQLDLLAATMDKVADAVWRADAQALIVHGRFLQEKFGAPSGGGLDLGSSAMLPPMPGAPDPLGTAPGSAQGAPAQRSYRLEGDDDTGDVPLAHPRPEPPQRPELGPLTPPIGREG